VNTFNIPGVKDYAFFMKELVDARKVRSRLIENFERASNPNTAVQWRERLLHVVIVGAGPTGIELAAEIHDLIQQDLKKYFPEDILLDVRMTVLEASETVLSAFDTSLQKMTMKLFKRQGIKIRTGKKVQAVKDEFTVELTDGSVVECGMVIWSAGIQARQLLMKGQVPLPLEPRQKKIIVDDHLRVQGYSDIYAMGDCAVVESKPLAATAQVAQQQGKYLAKIINSGSEDKPFIYHHQGLMAYIGNFHAITEISSVKWGGYLSWILWRSAYFTRLVSWKNKILVPFNWMVTFLFGRDISRF
jgi:NADH:ubiquinone reductase (non-electrogenic)